MNGSGSLWETAYIGLGSNLDHPAGQVRSALCEIAALPGVCELRCSSLYRSAPVGPPGQPDYINAVMGVQTRLDPHALLAALQTIEQRHGRVRQVRWGPRTLDLDLLLYGGRCIQSEHLTVPHPQLLVRPFVLYPLAEIAPDVVIPGHGPIAACLVHCPPEGLERLSP